MEFVRHLDDVAEDFGFVDGYVRVSEKYRIKLFEQFVRTVIPAFRFGLLIGLKDFVCFRLQDLRPSEKKSDSLEIFIEYYKQVLNQMLSVLSISKETFFGLVLKMSLFDLLGGLSS